MTVTLNSETVVAGYAILHVLFGLITHYHSVAQVRAFNKDKRFRDGRPRRVTPGQMVVLFVGRMILGLPWFFLSRIVAPVGSSWHMTPEQICE